MELHTNRLTMRYDIDQRPSRIEGLFLSFQHVFAMFGATILVPLTLRMPVSVALMCSGLGTLIYAFFIKGKVPVYLGSSFAFIGAMKIAMEQMGRSTTPSSRHWATHCCYRAFLSRKCCNQRWLCPKRKLTNYDRSHLHFYRLCLG